MSTPLITTWHSVLGCKEPTSCPFAKGKSGCRLFSRLAFVPLQPVTTIHPSATNLGVAMSRGNTHQRAGSKLPSLVQRACLEIGAYLLLVSRNRHLPRLLTRIDGSCSIRRLGNGIRMEGCHGKCQFLPNGCIYH
jgi:hypothetical protein